MNRRGVLRSLFFLAVFCSSLPAADETDALVAEFQGRLTAITQRYDSFPADKVEYLRSATRREATQALRQGMDFIRAVSNETRLPVAERRKLLRKVSEANGKFFLTMTAPFADAEDLPPDYRKLRGEGWHMFGAASLHVLWRLWRMTYASVRDVSRLSPVRKVDGKWRPVVPYVTPFFGTDGVRSAMATDMMVVFENELEDEFEETAPVREYARDWDDLRWDGHSVVATIPLVAYERVRFAPRWLLESTIALGRALRSWIPVRLEEGKPKFGFPIPIPPETPPNLIAEEAEDTLLALAGFEQTAQVLETSEPVRFGPNNESVWNWYVGIGLFLAASPGTWMYWELEDMTALSASLWQAPLVVPLLWARLRDSGLGAYRRYQRLKARIAGDPKGRGALVRQCGGLLDDRDEEGADGTVVEPSPQPPMALIDTPRRPPQSRKKVRGAANKAARKS